MYKQKNYSGSIHPMTVAFVLVVILAISSIGLAVWGFINYNEEKNTVNEQVKAAELNKEKEVSEKLNTEFLEKEKLPTLTFAGPEDYGSLTFKYPKIWSVYVEKDANNGGSFQAYLHPYVIPPVSAEEKFALRVLIEENSYDSVVKSYESNVKSGKLKASPVTVDGVTGLRLDGNFSTDIRGSAVIFKLRDKTVTIRTDADTFGNDFSTLVGTMSFVK